MEQNAHRTKQNETEWNAHRTETEPNRTKQTRPNQNIREEKGTE